MMIEPGMKVRYIRTRGKTFVRTVIGVLDGDVYMRVGENSNNVESCKASMFWQVYEKAREGGAS